MVTDEEPCMLNLCGGGQTTITETGPSFKFLMNLRASFCDKILTSTVLGRLGYQEGTEASC